MANAKGVLVVIPNKGTHHLFHESELAEIKRMAPTNFDTLIGIVGIETVVGLLLKFHRKEVIGPAIVLAKKAKLSESSINRIENGQKMISKAELKALSKILPKLVKDLETLGIEPA